MKTLVRTRSESRRVGTAQLQLLVFLPLLVAMLVAIMAVGDFARLRSSALIQARNNAWSAPRRKYKRLKLPKSNTITEFARILGNKQSPMDGLAVGEAKVTSEKATAFGGGTTSARHVVLMDTWDYHSVRFQNSAAKPKLTMDSRAKVFAKGTGLAGLGSLLAGRSIDDIEFGAFVKQAAFVADRLNPNRLNDRIRQMREKLTELKSQRPLPSAEIQSTSTALQNARKDLRFLNRQMDKLEKDVPGVKQYFRLPPIDWFDSDLHDEDELGDQFDSETVP